MNDHKYIINKFVDNSWAFVLRKKKKWIFDVPSVAFDVVPTEFDSISVAHYSNLPAFDSKFLAFDVILPAFNAEWGERGEEKDTNYHEDS